MEDFPYIDEANILLIYEELETFFAFSERLGNPITIQGNLANPSVIDIKENLRQYILEHYPVYKKSKTLAPFRRFVDALVALNNPFSQEDDRKVILLKLAEFLTGPKNASFPLIILACAIFFVNGMVVETVQTPKKKIVTARLDALNQVDSLESENALVPVLTELVDCYIQTRWFGNVVNSLVYISDFEPLVNAFDTDNEPNFKTLAALSSTIFLAANKTRKSLNSLQINTDNLVKFEETAAGKTADVVLDFAADSGAPQIKSIERARILYGQIYKRLEADLKNRNVSTHPEATYSMKIQNSEEFLEMYAHLITGYCTIAPVDRSDEFFKRATIQTLTSLLRSIPSDSNAVDISLVLNKDLIPESTQTDSRAVYIEIMYALDPAATTRLFAMSETQSFEVGKAIEAYGDAVRFVQVASVGEDGDRDEDEDEDDAQFDADGQTDGDVTLAALKSKSSSGTETGRWAFTANGNIDSLYSELEARLDSAYSVESREMVMSKFGLTQQQNDLQSICASVDLHSYLSISAEQNHAYFTRFTPFILDILPYKFPRRKRLPEPITLKKVYFAELDFLAGICNPTQKGLRVPRTLRSAQLPFAVTFNTIPMYIMSLLCHGSGKLTNAAYGMTLVAKKAALEVDIFVQSLRVPSQAAIYGLALSRLLEMAANNDREAIEYFESLVQYADGNVLPANPEETFGVWIAGYLATYTLLFRASKSKVPFQDDKKTKKKKKEEDLEEEDDDLATVKEAALNDATRSLLFDGLGRQLDDQQPSQMAIPLCMPRNIRFVTLAHRLLMATGSPWNAWADSRYASTFFNMDWSKITVAMDKGLPAQQQDESIFGLMLEVDRLLSRTPWLPNIFCSVETSPTFSEVLKSAALLVVKKCIVPEKPDPKVTKRKQDAVEYEFLDATFTHENARPAPASGLFIPSNGALNSALDKDQKAPKPILLDANAERAAVVMNALFQQLEDKVDDAVNRVFDQPTVVGNVTGVSSVLRDIEAVKTIDTLIAAHVDRLSNMVYLFTDRRNVGGNAYLGMTFDHVNHLHIPGTVMADWTCSPVILDQLLQNLIDTLAMFSSAYNIVLSSGYDPEKLNLSETLIGRCWNYLSVHVRTLKQYISYVTNTFQTDVYVEQMGKFYALVDMKWTIGSVSLETSKFIELLETVRWCAFSTTVLADLEAIHQMIKPGFIESNDDDDDVNVVAGSVFAERQSHLMVLTGMANGEPKVRRNKFVTSFLYFFADAFAAWNQVSYDFGPPDLDPLLVQSVISIPNTGLFGRFEIATSQGIVAKDSDYAATAKISADVGGCIFKKHTYGIANITDLQYPGDAQVRRFVEFLGPILTKLKAVFTDHSKGKAEQIPVGPKIARPLRALIYALQALLGSMQSSVTTSDKVYVQFFKEPAPKPDNKKADDVEDVGNLASTSGMFADRGPIIRRKRKRDENNPSEDQQNQDQVTSDAMDVDRDDMDIDTSNEGNGAGEEVDLSPAKRPRVVNRTKPLIIKTMKTLDIFIGNYLLDSLEKIAPPVLEVDNLSIGAQTVIATLNSFKNRNAMALLVGRYLRSSADLTGEIFDALEKEREYTFYRYVAASPETLLKTCFDRTKELYKFLADSYGLGENAGSDEKSAILQFASFAPEKTDDEGDEDNSNDENDTRPIAPTLEFSAEKFDEFYALEVVANTGSNLLTYLDSVYGTVKSEPTWMNIDVAEPIIENVQVIKSANNEWAKISDKYISLVFLLIQNKLVAPMLQNGEYIHDVSVLFSQNNEESIKAAMRLFEESFPMALNVILSNLITTALSKNKMYPKFEDFLKTDQTGDNLKINLKTPDLPLQMVQDAIYCLSGQIKKVYVISSNEEDLESLKRSIAKGKIDLKTYNPSNDHKVEFYDNDDDDDVDEDEFFGWYNLFELDDNTRRTLVVLATPIPIDLPTGVFVLRNLGNFAGKATRLGDYQLIEPATGNGLGAFSNFNSFSFRKEDAGSFKRTDMLGGTDWKLAAAKSRLRREQTKTRQLSRRVTALQTQSALKDDADDENPGYLKKVGNFFKGLLNTVLESGNGTLALAMMTGLMLAMNTGQLGPTDGNNFVDMSSNYDIPLQKKRDYISRAALLRSKLEEAKKRLQLARSKAGVDTAKIAQLETNITDVQRNLDDSVSNFNDMVTQTNALIATQAEELIQAREDAAEKAQELAQARTDFAARVQLHELEKQALEQARVDLEQEKQTATSEIVVLNQTITFLEASLVDRTREIATLTQRAREELSRAEQLVEQFKQTTMAGEAKIAELNARILELQSALREKESVISQQNISSTLSMQDQELLRIQLIDARTETMMKVLDLNDTIASLRRELTEARLQQQPAIAASNADLAALRQEIRALEIQKLQASSDIESKTMELEQLQQRLDESTRKYEEYRQEITRTTQALKEEGQVMRNRISQLEESIALMRQASANIASRCISPEEYTSNWRGHIDMGMPNLASIACLIYMASTLGIEELTDPALDFVREVFESLQEYTDVSSDTYQLGMRSVPAFAAAFTAIPPQDLFQYFFGLFDSRILDEATFNDVTEFRAANSRLLRGDRTAWTIGWFVYLGIFVTNFNVYQLAQRLALNAAGADDRLTRLFRNCPIVLTLAKQELYNYMASDSISDDVKAYFARDPIPRPTVEQLNGLLSAALVIIDPSTAAATNRANRKLNRVTELILSAYSTPSFVGLVPTKPKFPSDIISYMIHGTKDPSSYSTGMAIYNSISSTLMARILRDARDGYVGNLSLALFRAIGTGTRLADVYEVMVHSLLGIATRSESNKYVAQLKAFEDALASVEGPQTNSTAATNVSFLDLTREQAKARKASRLAEKYRRERISIFNLYSVSVGAGAATRAELDQREREVAALTAVNNANQMRITELSLSNDEADKLRVKLLARKAGAQAQIALLRTSLKVITASAVSGANADAIVNVLKSVIQKIDAKPQKIILQLEKSATIRQAPTPADAALANTVTALKTQNVAFENQLAFYRTWYETSERRISELLEKTQKQLTEMGGFKERMYKTVGKAMDAYFEEYQKQEVEYLENLVVPSRKQSEAEKIKAELDKLGFGFLTAESQLKYTMTGLRKLSPARVATSMLASLPQTEGAKSRFRIPPPDRIQPQPKTSFGLSTIVKTSVAPSVTSLINSSVIN